MLFITHLGINALPSPAKNHLDALVELLQETLRVFTPRQPTSVRIKPQE